MNSIYISVGVVILLNRYNMKLSPSIELDYTGRVINIFQILAHIPPALLLLTHKYSDPIPTIESTSIEFFIVNVLDIIGWLAIFSRLEYTPFIPKTIANQHIAAQMMSFILGHKKFAEIFLSINNIYLWDLYKGLFILTDPFIRGYYHFYVLKNY